MADDPVYPLTGNRVMADDEDRGNGAALVQRLRVVGTNPAPASVEAAQVGTSFPGGLPDSATPHPGLVTWDQKIVSGGANVLTGYQLASHNYVAGRQVGDPIAMDNVGGVTLTNTQLASFTHAFVKVTDAEQVLDANCVLWLVQDLGGGLGDAGDDVAVTFDPSVLAYTGRPCPVAQQPDGTPHVHYTATARVILFDVPEVMSVGPNLYAVIESGGGAGGWTAAGSVAVNYGGALSGFYGTA